MTGTNVTQNYQLKRKHRSKIHSLENRRNREHMYCTTGIQLVVHYKYQIPLVAKWLTCPRYIWSTYITPSTLFCRWYHTGAGCSASTCHKLCWFCITTFFFHFHLGRWADLWYCGCKYKRLKFWLEANNSETEYQVLHPDDRWEE